METTEPVRADRDDDALLLSDIAVGSLLSVSRAHIHALNNSGRLPAPIKLGRSTRWRRDELIAWVNSGCPSRERWEAMQSEN